MRRVRTFRISDENYGKVKDFVAELEGKRTISAEEIFARHKKKMSDILVWCNDNKIELGDIKEAFAIAKATRVLKGIL